MHIFTRRLQILLDEERYARLAAEAERTNLSVAAVIRRAIDRVYPPNWHERTAAAERILAAAEMPVPDVEELKAELDEIRAGKL